VSTKELGRRGIEPPVHTPRDSAPSPYGRQEFTGVAVKEGGTEPSVGELQGTRSEQVQALQQS
jgi:hypothetical protein